MTISAIVAVSQNGVIGKAGGLPWHLPDELARFKRLTLGHPIIMGRKTHESIGRALPGRRNIIITHDQSYIADGCETTNSVDMALSQVSKEDEVFIIGGSSIYEQAMPKINKIYLTRVGAVVDGDKYFKFNESDWNLISSEKHPADEKNKYTFEFQEWVRKK